MTPFFCPKMKILFYTKDEASMFQKEVEPYDIGKLYSVRTWSQLIPERFAVLHNPNFPK